MAPVLLSPHRFAPLGGASYSATVLADGPIAYYRLSETSGTTVADSSGNARHMTAAGGYTRNQASLISTDPTNPSTLFSGGQATVAADAGMQALTVGSFEAWVKPANLTGTQIVFGRTNLGSFGTTNYQAFLARGAGGWQFTVYAGGTVTDCIEPAATAAIGVTQHLLGTYDGANIKLYVNGSLSNTVAKAGTFPSGGTLPLMIAAPDRSGFRFAGNVDEAALYPTALSAARATAHYAAA